MKKTFEIMHINSGVGKLITVMISVFFIVHMVACIWYASAEMRNFSPDTWVARQELLDASVEENYLTACYWAFQTLTTVGYGDVAALTLQERIIAIFWMVFGVAFYSYTIGNF
jgi:voltage-gated potassium channel Kch